MYCHIICRVMKVDCVVMGYCLQVLPIIPAGSAPMRVPFISNPLSQPLGVIQKLRPVGHNGIYTAVVPSNGTSGDDHHVKEDDITHTPRTPKTPVSSIPTPVRGQLSLFRYLLCCSSVPSLCLLCIRTQPQVMIFTTYCSCPQHGVLMWLCSYVHVCVVLSVSDHGTQ